MIVVLFILLPIFISALYCKNERIFFVLMFFVEFLLFSLVSPVNKLIMLLQDEKYKTDAVAMQIFITHIFGDLPASFLIGIFIDLVGIQDAMLSLFFMLFLVIFFAFATLLYHKYKY